MTQVNTQKNRSSYTVLREVMHLVATTPEPHACIEPILEVANGLTGAQAAGFLLFRDPHLSVLLEHDKVDVPAEEALEAVATGLPIGVHVNPTFANNGEKLPFKHWVLSQVCNTKKQSVAVMWLVLPPEATLNDEIKASLEALNDALTIVTTRIMSAARHEKLGRNQSEFMRIVSHDLRSPLTSMQGFASMLESGMVGELNEKQEQFVEKILAGITQMTSLVENIQDAGRFDPETGFYEVERSQCDLTEMVQRISGNYLLPAEKQELTLMSNIADDIPIIYVDINMFERAISNLIDNAIKYTPNGRDVEVGLRKEQDNILLYVKDTGLGISKENQKLLFERHVRIPRKEHKRIKGSGLGLFIVRSVARRHGGDAWVKSAEGEGTTFFIRIPLNEENSILS